MADSDPVELLKLLGGIAGLATAAFTIYDRAIRSRPIANLNADAPELWLGVPATVYLQIKNPTDRDLIIEEISTSREPSLRVGTDMSTSGIIWSVMGVKHLSVIPAGEERAFPIWIPRDEDPTDYAFSIEIRWRPVTAYFFGRIPVTLRLSTGILRSLADEAERRREAARELSR